MKLLTQSDQKKRKTTPKNKAKFGPTKHSINRNPFEERRIRQTFEVDQLLFNRFQLPIDRVALASLFLI